MRSVKSFVLFALCTSLFDPSHAQGILPANKESSPESQPTHVLIGQIVPKTLTLVDTEGKTQPLLSMKMPTQVMVIGFYSPKCEANQAAWIRLKRLYEAYKDWGVSFLGVSVNSDENASELSEAMSHADLPYRVVRDPGQEVARRLMVTGTPQIVILDEWGQLRYRGPLDDAIENPEKKPRMAYARKALDAVISHQEAVPIPEPPGAIGCALR